MTNNKLSKGRPGGGMGSRVVKNVGVRTGKPAMVKNPGHVAQYGSAQGNHITDRGSTGYRGDPPGMRPASPNVKLGNQTALEAGQGPGAGRSVSRCGSQQGVSPATPIGPTKDTLAGR